MVLKMLIVQEGILTLFSEKNQFKILGNKVRFGGPVKHACLKTIFV